MYRWAMVPLAVLSVPAAARANPQAAIEAAMRDSAAGWDAGDLARFIAVYAPDAIYAAGGTVVRGKEAIAARYAKSFAGGGNVRGALGFRFLEWRAVGATHMLVVARWTLTPASGTKADTGLTTLLFERRAGRWLIVSDHSS